jgi:NADPH:quinone reductase-like Zn-dependent oxidoreductase
LRRAWYDIPGPAADVLVVGDADRPVPRDGEVLVRVHASGVNPADVRRRAGWSGAGYTRSAPRVVPHSDGAGVVEDTGPGVDTSWRGRRVWLWNAGGAQFYGFPNEGTDTGTASEYVALPVRFVAALPDEAGFDVGACLGGPACTAHFVVFADGDVRGKTVLVQGGTGAVSELAVQLAADAGAKVIATVSSAEKAALARAAGANHVVDRSRDDVADAVLAISPEGVDRIIEVEFGLNVATDARIIKANGIIASYSSPSVREPVLPYYDLQRKGVTVHYVQAYILPQADRRRSIDGVNRALRERRLRPTIAARFPLEDIAAAHELVESHRAIGNVVVTI